jgi:hypothetical protein
LVIVTPWDGAYVDGGPLVSVHYNVNGRLAANTFVFFSLDGGPRFTDFVAGQNYGLSPGWHTLRAWIGNMLAQEVPGTTGSTVNFHVPPSSTSPDGAAVAVAPAYAALAPGVALQGSPRLDAAPTVVSSATPEPPDARRALATSAAHDAQSRPLMHASGTDALGAPQDDPFDDGLLDELAEDVAIAGF